MDSFPKLECIENIISAVKDRRQRERDPESTKGIAIHRCGVNRQTGVVLGYDAKSICDAFLGRVPEWTEVAKATGGENAYTFFVGGNLGPNELDGVVWQALPLSEVGYHARRFSKSHIGVALIFDGRYDQPSLKQYSMAVRLVAELCEMLGLDPYRDVKGHGEIKGAHSGSKAPGQPEACPGHPENINLNIFRDDVAIRMHPGARRRLYELGLIF